jgi:hypothetical protein
MFKFISNIFIKNRDNADSLSTAQSVDMQFGKSTDKEVGELLKKLPHLRKRILMKQF